MDIRVEIIGINSTEFSKIFQHEEFPVVGSEVELDEGVKMVNLTSNTPNLVDSDIFSLIFKAAGDVSASILIGLMTNYLYDVLKSKKFNFKEHTNKIQVEVTEDNNEQP
jgi:hypothetical protein